MQSNSMKIHNSDIEIVTARTPATVPGDSVSKFQAVSKMQSAKRAIARASVGLVALSLGFPASASSSDQATTGPAVMPTLHPMTEMHPVKALKRLIEVGQASWYGLKFQGRKTATGETYDMNLMTCAHRNLPLGSWVKVTNLKNKKTVVVRVNDRGPALGSRIVDLSYAAARAVGLNGVGKVRLDTLKVGDPDLTSMLLAQVQMPRIGQVPAVGVLSR